MSRVDPWSLPACIGHLDRSSHWKRDCGVGDMVCPNCEAYVKAQEAWDDDLDYEPGSGVEEVTYVVTLRIRADDPLPDPGVMRDAILKELAVLDTRDDITVTRDQ